MNITKTADSGKLLLSVNGRVDSTTAPELNSAIMDSIADINELTLDFSGVEYVSSAGLRVLLSAQKQMKGKGKMVLKNVCDEVMEVFTITGFTDILNIEK